MPYIQSFRNRYSVSLRDWQHGYVTFPFDLTPDRSASSSHWCPSEQGNIRVKLGFENALSEPVTIIVYSEFRELMQIDRNREVILS
jgi:hypothetical protein